MPACDGVPSCCTLYHHVEVKKCLVANLDVIHATNAFQTRVCNAARDVIGAARDRISMIAKLAEPLDAPANAFVDPAGADNNF